MAKDVSEVIGTALGNAAREAIQNVSKNAHKRSRGPVSGPKGLAAGAAGVGLLALAPLAAKGVSKAVSGAAEKGKEQINDAGGKVGEKIKADVMDSIPGAGLFSKAGGGGLFSKSDDSDEEGGKSQGMPGVGKGRRMPVQQDIDIGVPISTVYNQWTQFEEWPKFMHRVTQVSQEDESHVNFKTKIWGKTKEYTAEIVDQRPDERIKWRVTEGVTHTGVVTFHELGPRLTRVEVSLDVDPGSLIEKAARGMRFVKRAVRADLARFKAYILMEDEESGEWRGRIDDGDVKKESQSRGRRASQSRSSNGSSQSRSSRASGSRSSGSSQARSGGSSQSRASRSSQAQSSGSSQSRGRSTSRRSRGSTNGGGRSSSAGSGGPSSSRRRSGTHS
jgi:uncharacterized membrane protein